MTFKVVVSKQARTYISDEESGVVTIIRVMYGGRNVDAQLKSSDYIV